MARLFGYLLFSIWHFMRQNGRATPSFTVHCLCTMMFIHESVRITMAHVPIALSYAPLKPSQSLSHRTTHCESRLVPGIHVYHTYKWNH